MVDTKLRGTSMKKHLVLFLIAISIESMAQPPIIVEVVEDKKATVYVPPGVKLSPGDMLVPQGQNEPPMPAPEMKPPEVPQIVGNKELRPRDHMISFNLGMENLEVEIDSISTRDEVDSTLISAEYYRNFGYFQPGIGYGFSRSSTSQDDDRSASLVAMFRLNFIENSPNNDLIPFASVGVGHSNIKYKDDSGTDFNLTGPYTGLGVGLTWFPFGELVGIEISLERVQGDLDYSGTPAFNGDTSFKRSSFNFGYVLAF